ALVWLKTQADAFGFAESIAMESRGLYSRQDLAMSGIKLLDPNAAEKKTQASGEKVNVELRVLLLAVRLDFLFPSFSSSLRPGSLSSFPAFCRRDIGRLRCVTAKD